MGPELLSETKQGLQDQTKDQKYSDTKQVLQDQTKDQKYSDTKQVLQDQTKDQKYSDTKQVLQNTGLLLDTYRSLSVKSPIGPDKEIQKLRHQTVLQTLIDPSVISHGPDQGTRKYSDTKQGYITGPDKGPEILRHQTGFTGPDKEPEILSTQTVLQDQTKDQKYSDTKQVLQTLIDPSVISIGPDKGPEILRHQTGFTDEDHHISLADCISKYKKEQLSRVIRSSLTDTDIKLAMTRHIFISLPQGERIIFMERPQKFHTSGQKNYGKIEEYVGEGLVSSSCLRPLLEQFVRHEIFAGHMVGCCPCCGFRTNADEEQLIQCKICKNLFHRKTHCVGEAFAAGTSNEDFVCEIDRTVEKN
ncbi:Hypothetical predicted protein [Mytilus galloprovincialis]|uniref:Uncharacterized protein n=1 Tax=Mytilus galloprovincialis TaxID=29158 RepID=A0A8B6ELT4_MYTGA|nr:Hypothetical predicted protein [Mytilus galloprovincialis]